MQLFYWFLKLILGKKLCDEPIVLGNLMTGFDIGKQVCACYHLCLHHTIDSVLELHLISEITH